MTELRPYPPYGGQFIHTYNNIESLCRNFSVIVLAPAVSSDCELLQKVEAWHNLPLEFHPIRHNVNKIIRHRFKPWSAWYICLEQLYKLYKPKVTWFGYGHWGQYTDLARKYGSKTIMGTHNSQAKLTRQRCQATPFGSTYIVQRLNYLTQHIHEQRFFSRFDRIISVSESDRRYHTQFVSEERSLLLPNYINDDWYKHEKPIIREENLIIMTGQFDTFQNRQGLKWFLNEVWPLVLRQIPQLQLQLVGRGSQSLDRLVRRYQNVVCIGETPTMIPYFRRATIAVVPLLYGSGTRIKILEALACKTPVVSTTLGAQGLDLVHGVNIMLADTGLNFAKTLLNLLRDSTQRSKLAQNGMNILRDKYSFDLNTKHKSLIIIFYCINSIM